VSSPRDLCLERDEGKCFRCGTALTSWHSCHHRRLRSGGGTTTLDNLIMLCGSGTTGCHGWVHKHAQEARSNGWIVSRYGTGPADVPARHWQWGLVYLTEDGSVNPWGGESNERKD
jgi:hypothetical protein